MQNLSSKIETSLAGERRGQLLLRDEGRRQPNAQVVNRRHRDALDQAYQLAFFIHRDRIVATEVTTEAMDLVEVASVAQDKRRYYKLIGRRLSGVPQPLKRRNKVSMSETQLLQRLIYAESEVRERLQEQDARSRGRLTEEDLTIRYIEYLVQICLRRNALHVTLGLARLLYRYTTGETMAIYELLCQDPDYSPEPVYYRKRKQILMRELKARFGSMVRTRRGPRGEERFEAWESTNELRDLVRKCLERFTPWETRCVLPERFDPWDQELAELRYEDDRPWKEDLVAMNRIHTILHPDCLSKLTRAFGLAPPEKRLAIPRFYIDQRDGDGDRDNEEGGDPDRDGELSLEQRRVIESELRRRAERRRRKPAGILRVLVDHVEAARLDLGRASVVRFGVAEGASLIEVRSGVGEEEVRLAAHLCRWDTAKDLRTPGRSSVTLPGGQRITFSISLPSGADSGDAAVAEVRFSKAPVVAHAAARLWRRLTGTLEKAMPGASEILGPVALAAAVALAAIGVSLYLHTPEPLEPISSERLPRPAREPTAPSPQAPAPDPRQTRGTEPPAPAPIRLADVERIYVESLGAEPFHRQLRDQLIAQLRASGRFVVPELREAADAILRLDGPGEVQDEAVELALRLVSRDGEVLWRVGIRGPAAAAAARIVAELEVEGERRDM